MNRDSAYHQWRKYSFKHAMKAALEKKASLGQQRTETISSVDRYKRKAEYTIDAEKIADRMAESLKKILKEAFEEHNLEYVEVEADEQTDERPLNGTEEA